LKLYIVSLPIGNLKDITLRAIETLKKVDFIICEDTRYSLKLLNHYNIKKPLISFYKPVENKKTDNILKRLEKENAALISDSGTPLISDPGNSLVKEAIKKGIEIEAIPGPTAFVPALVLSGLDTDRFLFYGFLPKKKNEIYKILEKLKSINYTIIFYESPKRIEKTLNYILDVFGNRKFSISKELTKKNEKTIRGELKHKEILVQETILGEMVIIIQGNKSKKNISKSINTIDELLFVLKQDYNISKNKLKELLYKKD